MRSSDETIIGALEILARDIQSGDGVANSAIAEAARRMRELCGIPKEPLKMSAQAYSTNGEDYHGSDDPHYDAQTSLDDESEPGQEREYWTADSVHPLNKTYYHRKPESLGEEVLERITDNAYDEIGGDDACLEMTDEQKTGLGQLILNFIRHSAKVTYFGIENEEKHTYVAGSSHE